MNKTTEKQNDNNKSPHYNEFKKQNPKGNTYSLSQYIHKNHKKITGDSFNDIYPRLWPPDDIQGIVKNYSDENNLDYDDTMEEITNDLVNLRELDEMGNQRTRR